MKDGMIWRSAVAAGALAFACAETPAPAPAATGADTATAASDAATVSDVAPDSGGGASDSAAQVDGTAAAGDAAGDVGATACPQAKLLLDLSNAPGAGGAYAKPTLAGTCDATTFTVTSNGMPHYKYVPMTPNALKEYAQKYTITRTPKVAATTTAIPLLGLVGFSVAGLPFFGPNEAGIPEDSAWGDPVYNGITDGCKGHTADQYHNHALEPKCLTQAGVVSEPWTLPDLPTDKASPLLGWAMDGFAVYGPYDCIDAACSKVVEFKSGYVKTGDPKKDAWKNHAYQAKPDDATVLDACNGRIGPDGVYRYHATKAFPYLLGCYKGTPAAGQTGGGGTRGGGGGGGNTGGGPATCNSDGDCTGKCPQGTVGCACTQAPQGKIGAPTCSKDADCPALPNGQPSTCQGGLCKPKMQ